MFVAPPPLFFHTRTLSGIAGWFATTSRKASEAEGSNKSAAAAKAAPKALKRGAVGRLGGGGAAEAKRERDRDR